jgi:branched-chain amino acid transport system ATP-binding protein
VLLVEQNAGMALTISSHGYILETGKMVMDKASADLLQDEDVKEFYLGLRSGDDSIRSFADVKQYRRKKRWLS